MPLDRLVPLVLKVLQGSPERRETRAKPSQSAACGERRGTPASQDPPVSPVWTVGPVAMDSLELRDPKELLALCW